MDQGSYEVTNSSLYERLIFVGVQPARRKRAIEANKIRGMKGTELLETRIKAQESQKVKSFKPNDTAEDDNVCDSILSLPDITSTDSFFRPNLPSLRSLQRRHREQQQVPRSAKHP